MMTPAEKTAYDAAMTVVFATHKYHSALEAAEQDWEAGEKAAPKTANQIDTFHWQIKDGVPITMELHDALSQTAS